MWTPLPFIFLQDVHYVTENIFQADCPGFVAAGSYQHILLMGKEEFDRLFTQNATQMQCKSWHLPLTAVKYAGYGFVTNALIQTQKPMSVETV